MARFARAAALAFAAAGSAHAFDPADCAGFSSADAARFLGVPAAQAIRTVGKVTPSLWTCSYGAGRSAPAIAFSLEVAPNPKKAAEQMESYRDNLVIAAETPQHRGRLPKGAFSDVMGLGDEAVWTDVNDSLTVRKGRITMQLTLPKPKADRLRLAQALLAKL